MPYKDPTKRREKSAGYSLAYFHRQKEKKTPEVCSTCPALRDDPKFKKCSTCRAYMRQYKTQYRTPKAAGLCTGSDCPNPADAGFKTCARCRERQARIGASPKGKAATAAWLSTLKPAAFAAYGGECLCCGELDEAFLSIDHIDGYTDGPRRGAALYSWLKQNNYPPGFRVLCHTCNFTLGHHGYCPHSTLIQVNRSGRPRIRPLTPRAGILAEKKRAYAQQLKLAVLTAYGGPRCVCCPEGRLECLSVDHINDDGAAHRRELTGNPQDGRNLYTWLRKNNFPPGFQVLCFNCNFAKGHGGCPHERARQASSTTPDGSTLNLVQETGS